MTSSFKRGTAIAGLSLCALFGATLAGCGNSGGAAAGGGADLATVGSSKISHADLTNLLEAQQGETALSYLIDSQLIFEDLKSKSLDVTDAEIDADLARRQATDPGVKTLIDAGGSKLVAAKNQIKRTLGIQKLLTSDVKVTDAELQTFLKTYHQFYDQPAKAKIGFLISSTKVRADLMSRELTQKSKTFADLVKEQKAAKDIAANQSTEDRGTFEPLTSVPPAVAAEIIKLPKGGSTKVQQLNIGLPTPAYAIFNKVDFQPAKPADLKTMHDEIEMDYKLAEVAKKTVAMNEHNPPFMETLTRTQQYMQSQNPTQPAPGLRDVLNYIDQTPANALLSGLRTNGTVMISDPNYAKVAQAYQAAPAAAAPGAAPAADANAASAPAADANAASAPAANAAPAPAKQ